MSLSLRTRVLLFIAAINVVMFGVGLVFLVNKLRVQRRAAAEEVLLHALQLTIIPGGDIAAATILRWPTWRYFDDAIIVSAGWERGAHGELRPKGAFLNPVGRIHRPSTFDQAGVLNDLAQAVESGRTVPSSGGLCIPIFDPQGSVWGGCWFVADTSVDTHGLVQSLLPWFLVSTAVLTLGTFFVLRRFVLDPVDLLAQGARGVADGDLSVRLPEPARRDELSELIRGFNQMTATVQSFSARLAEEVDLATQNARRAEAAALTQRRLAAMGELAAGIAHEINNPLGGLLNAVETLSTRDLPREKRAQYEALLKNGLERIQATVGQLLRFTPRAAQAAPVSLAQPVIDALDLVHHRAEKQGVHVQLTSSSAIQVAERSAVVDAWRALPLVVGQPNELAQAVLNLLVNALDALERKGRGEGRILVDLARAGDELALSVSDNGPGVAPEDLPRVADLFFTTKEVGKGTGLGLSIVHTIVSNHGGRVQMSSPPGGGFRVEIFLPVWDGTPWHDSGERGAARGADGT